MCVCVFFNVFQNGWFIFMKCMFNGFFFIFFRLIIYVSSCMCSSYFVYPPLYSCVYLAIRVSLHLSINLFIFIIFVTLTSYSFFNPLSLSLLIFLFFCSFSLFHYSIFRLFSAIFSLSLSSLTNSSFYSFSFPLLSFLSFVLLSTFFICLPLPLLFLLHFFTIL